jgi:predicted ATPase/DNA-binding SARP family transcriptional activator
MAVTADLDFRLLGPLEVVDSGTQFALGPRKQRALLALLLIRANTAVSAEWLIEALWDGAPPATASTAVQGYVSHLRKALGPDVIRTEPGGYSLRVDPDAIDARRFEARVSEAGRMAADGRPDTAAALLADALDEWRGPALADFEYESFARDEASRLDELRIQALEDRITADLALRRHGQIVHELRALAREHPLRERLHAALMLALYRAGRQADALDAYRDARNSLDELGLEPSRKLQDLERAILNRDASLDAPSIATPPARTSIPATPFVGREHELEALSALLADPAVRLVTLTGIGGTGKTRLAHELATRIQGHYRGGFVFVPLAGVADPTLLLPAIAQGLGLPEVAGESIEARVVERLVGGETLLILDNLEQLLGGVSDIAALLAAAPIQIVATSRSRLRLSAEHEFAVAPLERTDSLQLFAQRAAALRPDFVPGVEELRTLDEICQQLDDLPLALELAAARLKLLSPELLLKRLDRRLRVLTDGASDLPRRQQTLRATLDWSFALLDGDEQRLLSAIAVFAGGATIDAIEELDAEEDVFERITSLVDKSFVRAQVQPDGGTRIRMLQIVREYALEKLGGRADAEEIETRHATYFVRLAVRAEPELIRTDQAVWFDHLDREHDNIRAALDFLTTKGPIDDAVQLAAALWRFWQTRGHLTEGSAWLDRVIRAAGSMQTTRFAHALNGAACLAESRGDSDAAIAYHGRAAALYEALGEIRGLAWSLNNVALVLTTSGDLANATASLERSLELAGHVDDRWLEASALINLGNIAYFEEDYDRAEAFQERGRVLSDGLGDTWRAALACLNLGWIHVEQRCSEKAEARFREAVSGFQRLHEMRRLPDALEGLAVTAVGDGASASAARLFGAAEGIRETISVPRSVDEEALYAPYLVSARETLGADAYEAELATGRAMDAAAATAFALGARGAVDHRPLPV